MIHPNRTLTVLSAPSVWDDNYKEDFIDIISFQLDFAKTIHEYENVVILADKHTMPYLDGRNSKIGKKLPYDALIETNIYDVNINDFAPMGYKQLAKFIYRSELLADMASIQIDDSMERFLTENRIKIENREQDMILSGEQIVHNGINKALVSDSVVLENIHRLPDWAMMIKLLNSFKKASIVILAVSPIDLEVREELEKILKKKFRNDLNFLDLPLGGAPDDDGNCGIYTAVVSNPKFVYVPVFGNDPSNWKYGYSTMTDRMVLHLLEANSKRKIVPVNIPRAICRRGLSLRSLAWTVKGYVADSIVNLARRKF
ncbi:hypothetical protein FO519_006888 [Halicephalobus sp. NKZ332]|nr:hypothetical protein FO519_006888 [Halicephalobus sp. NKZ332]